MDLYHKLDNDHNFINFFCDVLEDIISIKKGYKVTIVFKKHDMSIFFFIDGSSILQVMPDKDLQYTYANSPSYEDDIQQAINIVEKQFNREERINQIIKKES
jgi:predicted Zn-dependent protease